MIRSNGWYALMAAGMLLWHECGYDLGVFCYRIGCSAFCAAGQRAFELVPLRALARTNPACSSRSFIFYVPSTTPKD
jgi:hypothetical protein